MVKVFYFIAVSGPFMDVRAMYFYAVLSNMHKN